MSALHYTATTDNLNPHKTLLFTITHNSTENGKLFDDFPRLTIVAFKDYFAIIMEMKISNNTWSNFTKKLIYNLIIFIKIIK